MPIAIVGSGRSGTSMVTRMLNLCGLYLGPSNNCNIPDEHNPKGYWENNELFLLNERLLEVLNGSYSQPPVLESGWEFSDNLNSFYEEAKMLIEQLFGDHKEWVWKLPQATTLLPFWKRVIPGLKCIICVRNPLDYATSVQKLHGLNRDQALAVWQLYNFEVLATTSPADRQFTFYEDFFPDYRRGLYPLLDWLGIAKPEVNSELEQAIQDFHEPSLKHYSTTVSELMDEPRIPYLVKELYLELLASGNRGELPIMKFADRYLPLLRQAVVGENTRLIAGTLQPLVADLKRELEMTVRSRDALQRSSVALLRSRDEIQASHANLERSWLDLERKLDAAADSRNQLAERNKELERILASRTHRIASRVCDLLIRLKNGCRRSTPSRPAAEYPPRAI